MEPNSNCRMKLKIVEAKFLKDADFLGKQDPFVQFVYDDREYKTATKDDAGKHAVFNEEFMLEDIGKQIKLGGSLTLNAYDEDAASSDWLGASKPQTFADLIANANENRHDLELLDAKKKKAGNIVFTT